MGENLRRQSGGFHKYQRQAQAKRADSERKGSEQGVSCKVERERGKMEISRL